MIRAQIVSPWIGTGVPYMDPYRPAFADDYTYVSYTDVTGQGNAQLPPSPNLYVLEVIVSNDVFDVLEADTDYLVLWSEDV